jgi:hypothetical protein
MPTDPFLSPDPADRPRQQQNLPPGVALPPAGRWSADRPGDLGPEQPGGRLLGVPGPNVGYAYTLAERAKDRLALGPHEDVHDVVSVVAEIAGKRAASFGRAPVIGDIDVAVGILGYDGSANDDFVELRSHLVREAAHDYSRRRSVVDTVPERLLRLPATELGDHVDEWRSLARAKLLPELGRQRA